MRGFSAEKGEIFLNEVQQRFGTRRLLQSQRILKYPFRCEGILVEDFMYRGVFQTPDLIFNLYQPAQIHATALTGILVFVTTLAVGAAFHDSTGIHDSR
jgi:hypothetical protein